MERSNRNIYCFISDRAKKFYRAVQQKNGNYSITSDARPYPIKYNPSNLLNSAVEFATNNKYFSLNRSITYPLDFIKDGAAILRNFYHLGKGTEHEAFLTIIQWNGGLIPGRYELAYYGKFDFSQKQEDPKSGIFTVPTIDDSAWGILSQNDNVVYSVDCSAANPKAIRVLFDNFTLKNTYTFQPVAAPIVDNNANNGHVIPFVQINQDGDSSGILTKNQTGEGTTNVPAFVKDSKNFFLTTFYAINNVNISGTFTFTWSSNVSRAGGLIIYFLTNFSTYGAGPDDRIKIFDRPGGGTLIRGQIYTVDFNFNINLRVGENIFFIAELNDNAANHFTITPIVTNIYISTKTVTEPVVAYGLRSLDLLQDLTKKATRGRFTINSNYFTTNNKDICLSGDSIRGIENPKIYSSFSDWFTSFDSIYFLALRVANGDLFVEKAIEVYKRSTQIIDLGDCIDFKPSAAGDYFANEIEVGSPKQDYRHASGRLEFNSTNTFSLPILTVNKKISIVSKYRLDCYGIIFLILDYRGASTRDNSGDKTVFVVKITDEQGTAVEDIETFENITINNAPLQPLIKYPINNDTINYNKPVIRGIAPASSNVNIYVDTVLDGSTTSDSAGNWSYNINTTLSSYNPGLATGIHSISASYTTISAPIDTISLTIDTTVTTQEKITYPGVNDSLYNNKPLIKGVAQRGTNIDIFLDANLIGSVVADNSCKWQFKSGVIPNGNHIISINATNSIPFHVDSNVAFPLITYIGSELDGFVIINNMPLIEGVAQPGTIVTLWLNYITYASLGTAVADANGNWSFQVIPVTYIDPLSGFSTTLAPIMNGLNVISTSLVNHTVGINVTGYKLSRPAYNSITGVIDNSVFNTEYSPKRMLLNRSPLWSAILQKLPGEKITYQTSDKNGNLRTVLGTEVIAENTDVPRSSLGNPIAMLEYGLIRTKANNTFAKTLYNFNNGGIIKVTDRGNDIYCLPIGNMKIDNIASDVQEWKLLLSPDTTFQTLLNLYKNGTIINLMQNSIYHSDYNSLHFVTYNYQLPAKYNFKNIYDDWFSNRNSAWALNPEYIKKFQTSENRVVDQVITNGISEMTLRLYRCRDAKLIDTLIYNAVSQPPLNPPEIVLEAIIDFSAYNPNEQYFFVQMVGELMVSISEPIHLKTKWDKTILIESSGSINEVGAFFSTGFKTIIRIDGLVKKYQPDILTNVAREESGDSEILFSNVSRKRMVRFGNAYGLPDYEYLKVANALTLDNLFIENEALTLQPDQKIEPSDDVEAHPLYYYNVILTPRVNNKGVSFVGGEGGIVEGVILVVDASAVGLPTGSLINIQL